MVAVGYRPAVARNVLDDGKNAAAHQADHGGTRQDRNFLRRPRISAIADDGVTAFDRNIENRQAIDVYSNSRQIFCNEPRNQAHGPQRAEPVAFEHLAIVAGGRIFSPMRRPQTLDPATLLVDEHGRVAPSDGFTKGVGQASDLIRRFDVALEQNEAPGLGGAEKRRLILRQSRAGTAGYEGSDGHGHTHLFENLVSGP